MEICGEKRVMHYYCITGRYLCQLPSMIGQSPHDDQDGCKPPAAIDEEVTPVWFSHRRAPSGQASGRQCRLSPQLCPPLGGSCPADTAAPCWVSHLAVSLRCPRTYRGSNTRGLGCPSPGSCRHQDCGRPPQRYARSRSCVG